jgi:hypothetical protein
MISKQIVGLLLAIVVVGLILGGSKVHAQFPCRVNVTFDYPKQVMPAQPIHIATFATGSCASLYTIVDSYSVRVDVTDQSGWMVSSNSSNTGYGSQTFALTVLNSAVAPTFATTWILTLRVYVFAAGVSTPSYSTVASAVIQVGGINTAQVVSVTSILLTTVQPKIVTTQTVTIVQSPLSRTTVQGLAIILAVAVVVFSLLLKNVREGREEKTRVY